MALLLTEFEARVLGVLLEKSMSTPDYYPMSANAIVLGCNQKNNRFPLVQYQERDVASAIEGLREKRLTSIVHEHGARVPKYMHLANRDYPFDKPVLAVLAVLLLRGPQTIGELRSRTESMFKFDGLQACEAALNVLLEYKPNGFALRLERASGEREVRFAHTLCGVVTSAREVFAAQPRTELEGRVEALEAEVRELRAVLDALREELGA